ncbi:hypothetical protein BDP27DRAFT_1528858 [Rhodocollybia butyracea]|uniref:Uncharacterized protein n=1 Tax=Rhodocollybia butyracea TaxID=206335 RepID=A0A9P5P4B8_9AGAR|nr:hypothetical protein BDP27DRAFT_1528858 [Rhodocollybia butyracea]
MEVHGIFGSESSTRDLAGSQDITRFERFERSSMAYVLHVVSVLKSEIVVRVLAWRGSGHCRVPALLVISMLLSTGVNGITKVRLGLGLGLSKYKKEYLRSLVSMLEYFVQFVIDHLSPFLFSAYGLPYTKRLGSNRCAKILRDEFNALQDKGEHRKWILRKQKELKAVQAHAKLCKAWHAGQLLQRSDELDDIRNQRVSDIMRRLTEIGWGEEVEIMSSCAWWEWSQFKDLKLVGQSKKLTDYAWNGIKDRLVEFLKERKRQRLDWLKHKVLQEQYGYFRMVYDSIKHTSDLREPFPALGNFFHVPPVEDLIWDTPFEEKLNADNLQPKLSEYLSSIIAEWKPAKIQELVEIMRKSGITEATASDLKLAKSGFRCSNCKEKMHYPQMFFHHCFVCYSPDSSVSERLWTWYGYSAAGAMGPWMADKLNFGVAHGEGGSWSFP